ncbi:MAG TPA: D-alanyl-D-alanine carboxypeptidase family protein [Dongiaceae bacterium]|jgi:D-alanyl-D-alanine carboxypeptidase (penicillin-binding protein 5/6)|nr:D-alanyl-D-alanine carboxypeptidase family protein [Dongiaceae bacterium]
MSSWVSRWLPCIGGMLMLGIAAGFADSAYAVDPPQTAAQHAYVVDYNTGSVLFDKQGEEKLYPASMSKLMTIYLLFESLKKGDVKLTDTFHVSQRAWATQGSKMFVPINSDVTVEDLLRGIIIQSGNDACVVVAEGLSGSVEAFVDRMNKKAAVLGLKGSHFANPDGLPDPEHWMTAQDLYVLAKKIFEDFPEYYHYFSEKEFTFHGIKQGNRNPLLYRPNTGVDGLKTGHTEEAGFGLVVSAIRDGRRIFMVQQGLGSMQNRADEGGQLLDWAFRAFGDYTVAKKGAVLAQANVWLGQQKTVPLTVPKDLLLTLPVSDRDKIVTKAVYDGPIAAPVAAGQQVGELVMQIPGMPDVHAPLVAAADVPQLGFTGRVVAQLQHLIFRED